MDVTIVLSDDSYQPTDAEGMRRKIAALHQDSLDESEAGNYWSAGIIATEAMEWEEKLRALNERRDNLGRLVRETWVNYCHETGDTKPSHIAPWDELSDWDKEADRRIGEAVQAFALPDVTTELIAAVFDFGSYDDLSEPREGCPNCDPIEPGPFNAARLRLCEAMRAFVDANPVAVNQPT